MTGIFGLIRVGLTVLLRISGEATPGRNGPFLAGTAGSREDESALSYPGC
jgi:hypothetical protein